MEVHVDAVLLAEAQQEVAGDPDLVGGLLRALAEDLELPLALRDLGVDALVVDAGLEAVGRGAGRRSRARCRRRSCSRRRCSTRPAAPGSPRAGSRAARRRGRGSTPARSRTTCRDRRGSSRGCSSGAASRPAASPRTSRARRWILAGSGKTATGCSMQSELLPSACRVELPSKPHIGSSSSVGNTSNSSIFVLPRRFGTGSWPSSQMYSSLYLAISSPPPLPVLCSFSRSPPFVAQQKRGPSPAPQLREKRSRPRCLGPPRRTTPARVIASASLRRQAGAAVRAAFPARPG